MFYIIILPLAGSIVGSMSACMCQKPHVQTSWN